MFKKTIIVFIFLVSIANTALFSQDLPIETVISIDSREIPESEIIEIEDISEFFEDYSIAERLGIGALNIFGGAGSITNGKRTGWLVTGIQGIGLLSILGGVIYGIVGVPSSPPEPPSGNLTNNEYMDAKERYDFSTGVRRGLITAGAVTIGTGVVVGLIIPFFHHRTDSANDTHANGSGNLIGGDFPFNLEIVSSNGQSINGFSISYKMSF